MTRKNLPAVIEPPIWAPERIVTFRGWTDTMVVILPARVVPKDPFTESFRAKFRLSFRNPAEVWDLVEKADIE